MYRWGLGYAPPPSNIATVLQNASTASGVPVNILQAVAFQESSYNPNAVSSAGAQGLLQLMPATSASLGVTDPFDAQQNANAGANYLASLHKQYGDWNTALIAYNEGPGNLANKGPFASSQDYASAILANAGIVDSVGPFVGPPVPADLTSETDSLSTASPVDSGGTSSGAIDPMVIAGIGLGLLGLVFMASKM